MASISKARSLAFVGSLALAGSAVIPLNEAVADHVHDPYYWENSRWDSLGDETRTPPWSFDDDVPVAHRTAIKYGADAWTAIPGYANFVYSAGDYTSGYFDEPCSSFGNFYQVNIVSRGSLDDNNHLAETKTCLTSRGTMSNFRIRYNPG